MKMKILIAGICIILLNSCVEPRPNIGTMNGYTIETITEGKLPPGETGYTIFKYYDYNELVSNKKKELSNNLSSEKIIKKELSYIPKGGMATINIGRTTLTEANTNNFEYVIFENGEEIYRKKGRNNIPNTPSEGDGTNWWNIDTLVFPKPIKHQMTIYIIDNFNHIRAKFILTKNKK